MNIIKYCIPLFVAVFALGCANKKEDEKTLKTALEGRFLIGTAMNVPQILNKDSAAVKIIKQHFNSVVAENCMKSENIHPEEGKYSFELADRFVEFGEENNMYIVGHVLIWHSQAPPWLFVDDEGNDVSRDVLIERMKNHITTLVSRYKGRVDCWDVVNEAILDDGSWRNNKFYEIIGKDYVKLAFQFAYEADPDVELLYNDYSMAHEGRRNSVVQLVKELQEENIKIDGIGMQAHCQMDFPPYDEFEKSIIAFSETGLDIHITEMDITVLPWPGENISAEVALNYEYQKKMNPYPEELTDSAKLAQQNRYMAFFDLFLKHSDRIKRVTMWGVNDSQSWRNDWPIPGRKDYPLLFDRDYKAKPIVIDIINAAGALND
jgi:endo-1,4-beta-xylanase